MGKLGDIEYKYYIDPRVLGTGCYGSVRECVERATGERYAVKSIRKSRSGVNAGDLARETNLLREMNHRSIIRLVDAYEDDEHLHIVTDLCEGGQLFDKIAKKVESGGHRAACFGENEAGRVLRQILEAVFYMHELGVAHRDLKPENVLFETADEDSRVRIVDFGLARKHSERRGAPPMTAVVGTSYYTAPEVLREGYGRSCDLWSVGVIAYVLLCGCPPFHGATDEELDDSVKRGEYVFPSRSRESRQARDFVRRLLQMNPNKRMTAKEALNHPWIIQHANTGENMEVRSDEDMVEGSSSADRPGGRRRRKGFVHRLLKKIPRRRVPVK